MLGLTTIYSRMFLVRAWIRFMVQVIDRKFPNTARRFSIMDSVVESVSFFAVQSKCWPLFLVFNMWFCPLRLVTAAMRKLGAAFSNRRICRLRFKPLSSRSRDEKIKPPYWKPWKGLRPYSLSRPSSITHPPARTKPVWSVLFQSVVLCFSRKDKQTGRQDRPLTTGRVDWLDRGPQAC